MIYGVISFIKIDVLCCDMISVEINPFRIFVPVKNIWTKRNFQRNRVNSEKIDIWPIAKLFLYQGWREVQKIKKTPHVIYGRPLT